MTFYEQKLSRIKEELYKNQAQIDAAVAIRKYIDNNYESDLSLEQLNMTHWLKLEYRSA